MLFDLKFQFLSIFLILMYLSPQVLAMKCWQTFQNFISPHFTISSTANENTSQN